MDTPQKIVDVVLKDFIENGSYSDWLATNDLDL